MVHARVIKDPFSTHGAEIRVDCAPEWFGPAIRGAIMQGTPVLALDEMVLHWREAWFQPEVLWHRLQLLPLVTGLPQLKAARVCLRASNRLFACSVTKVPAGGFALCMRSLTQRDIARDPEPMCTVGKCVRIQVLPGLKMVVHPDEHGPWRIDACMPDTVRYGATQEVFRAEVERWRAVLGTDAVLAPLQNAAWRITEPSTPYQPTVWSAVPAEPAVWQAERDDERRAVTFRLARHAELEADENDVLQAVSNLGAVAVFESEALITLEPEGDVPAGFMRVTTEGDGPFAFTLTNAPEADLVRVSPDALYAISRTPEGGVAIRRYVPRNDILQVTGSMLYAEPGSVRPEQHSDADWGNITVCHLARGDSVRFECTARLGTGVNPRWACACGGVPAFRPTLHPGGWSAAALERPPNEIEYDPSAWVVRVEPVGQLTAQQILIASSESLAESFQALAESLEYAYDDVAPRLALVDESAEGGS